MIMARVVVFAFQNPDDGLFNSAVRSRIHFGFTYEVLKKTEELKKSRRTKL